MTINKPSVAASAANVREIKICRLLPLVSFFMVTHAFADATGDARAHSEAFARAFEARDVKAIVALYADDARVIWPGQGDVANGKKEIEKLVVATLQVFPDAKLVLKSQEAIALGNGYIAIIGQWEQSLPGQDGKTD